MSIEYLTSITPEQRAEMQAKALASKQARIKFAIDHLKTDYADDYFWNDLARELDVRLPNKTSPNTEVKYLKRVLKQFDIDPKEYAESCGVKNLKELSTLNPTWTARAEVGMLLEYVQETLSSREKWGVNKRSGATLGYPTA